MIIFRRVALGVSALLMLSGSAGMGLHWYYQDRSIVSAAPGQPVITQPAVQEPTAISGRPVRLQIERLQIDVPVLDGQYDAGEGSWNVSNTAAHYALITDLPNTAAGNTLMYGHYRKEVFSRLRKLQPGDIAVVTTDNGLQFLYRYETVTTVEPTDTSIFSYRGSPRLTLQTCSGLFMQHRQLFGFAFMEFRAAN